MSFPELMEFADCFCYVEFEEVHEKKLQHHVLRTDLQLKNDFFYFCCVIGTPMRNWRAIDIPVLVGRTLINGNEAGKGVARDVMGHPFAALAWLANSLIARGHYLKRDEFVFTGSVVETRWINAGDHVTVEIAGLGITTVTFV